MNELLVALHLIVLHTVDGREVSVNPEQVTTLHATRDEGNKLVTDEAHCVVMLTDGKFVSVAEACDEVRKLLERRD